MSSEGRSQLRLVWLSSMHLSQVGWTTYCNSLLAGLSDELINKLQSVLRSATRQSGESGSSITLQMICMISCAGFQSVKESSTNLVFLSTNVYVVMLHHTLLI